MNDTFDDSLEARTVRRLRWVMAIFTGLLVASTWPLWTPGTEFPDIPWFAWAVNWPPEDWDWLWLASLGGLLVVQFAPLPHEGRWPMLLKGLLFAGALMLLPTDQHRLQPWAWQMLLGTILIAASPTDRAAASACADVDSQHLFLVCSVEARRGVHRKATDRSCLPD